MPLALFSIFIIPIGIILDIMPFIGISWLFLALAILFNFVPTLLLLPLRNTLAQIVSSQREEKPKILDEIDYYNGAVVKMGKELGLKTPANQRIYQRARFNP